MATNIKAGAGRVWTIRHRAGPGNTPYFHEWGVAGAPDWGLGDVTKIEVPDPDQYNQWITPDEFQASAERPTIPLTVRLTTERSELLDLVQLRCPFDAQVHFGTCDDPRDFDHGWDKIAVYEASYATNYSTTEQGAMEGGEQAGITEEVQLSVRDLYTILRIYFTEVAKVLVAEEVVAVSLCDQVACGDCDKTGDGVSTVFALTNAAGSSPGVLPQLIVTTDRYATAHERWITTFAIGENASDGACVGIYYVAISEDGEALHYAESQNVIDQDETWTKVTTGFVATKGPSAMWNHSPLATWFVGLGGYVYFSDDPTGGATVQDAGSTTTEDLYDVDGVSIEHVVAVGANNTVIYTMDGSSWQSVTGPDVGGAPSILAVGIRKEQEWWVGTDDGKVYFSQDRGERWTEVTNIPGTPTEINKIVWSTDTVGYMTIKQAGPAGKILRTINGGDSWYILPEQRGQSIPANDYINDIAVTRDVNISYAGGLADNGADGILMKITD